MMKVTLALIAVLLTANALKSPKESTIVSKPTASMGADIERLLQITDECHDALEAVEASDIACEWDHANQRVKLTVVYDKDIVTLCPDTMVENEILLLAGVDDKYATPGNSTIPKIDWPTATGDLVECVAITTPPPTSQRVTQCTYSLSDATRVGLVQSNSDFVLVQGGGLANPYEQQTVFVRHIFNTILIDTNGNSVVTGAARWADIQLQIRTYLQVNPIIGIDCTNLEAPPALEGEEGFEEYMEYMDCIAPVDLVPYEIKVPDCANCRITIKHSAVMVYADANWQEIGVREFQTLSEIRLIFRLKTTATPRRFKLMRLDFTFDGRDLQDQWFNQYDLATNTQNPAQNGEVTEEWDAVNGELRVTIKRMSLGESENLVWRGYILLVQDNGEYVTSENASDDECTCANGGDRRRRFLRGIRLLQESQSLEDAVAQQYLSEPLRVLEAVEPIVDEPDVSEPETGSGTGDDEESSAGTVILVIVLLLLVGAAVGGGVWYMKNKGQNPNTQQAQGGQNVQQDLPNQNIQNNQQ